MERPTLTIRQAAEAAGVSTKTIRRRLNAGAFPGAARDEDQAATWRIPADDLLVAGFTLNAPSPPDPAPERTGASQGRDELEAELVNWRQRALVAEAIAAERGAALEDARLALRALTAGQGAGAEGEPGEGTPESAATDPQPRRRPWWRRA